MSDYGDFDLASMELHADAADDWFGTGEPGDERYPLDPLDLDDDLATEEP